MYERVAKRDLFTSNVIREIISHSSMQHLEFDGRLISTKRVYDVMDKIEDALGIMTQSFKRLQRERVQTVNKMKVLAIFAFLISVVFARPHQSHYIGNRPILGERYQTQNTENRQNFAAPVQQQPIAQTQPISQPQTPQYYGGKQPESYGHFQPAFQPGFQHGFQSGHQPQRFPFG